MACRASKVPIQSIPLTPEAFEPFGQVGAPASLDPLQHQQQQEGRAISLPPLLLQVIQPTDDGKAFDMTDAQLELSKGTPRSAAQPGARPGDACCVFFSLHLHCPYLPHCRFYIMDLPRRGLSFSRITYHADVTQCLGGLNPPQPWYIVVAAPTGSVADYPKQQQLTAFKVPHGTAIKFKQGTWHAGRGVVG